MKTIKLAHSELTGTIYALIGKEKVDITAQAIAEVKAIESLDQEPCEDCISRAEVMTEIQLNAKRYSLAKECGGLGQVVWSDNLISINDALDVIRTLPSVTPTLKTGKKKKIGEGEKWDEKEND